MLKNKPNELKKITKNIVTAMRLCLYEYFLKGKRLKIELKNNPVTMLPRGNAQGGVSLEIAKNGKKLLYSVCEISNIVAININFLLLILVIQI